LAAIARQLKDLAANAKLNHGMSGLKLVAFDFGHTLIDERKDAGLPLKLRRVHLMPDVLDVLGCVPVPMAVWANTRTAREADVRTWLARAGIERFFTWVITSVDAGVRKPAAGFFELRWRDVVWRRMTCYLSAIS
jgi:FMN phosphatase YigB (HAD superfamily)